LERLLWQPAHTHPLLLYAMLAPLAPQPFAAHETLPAVQLVLDDGAGTITSIATCNCAQFAWSPDGNAILYSTGATYSVYSLATHNTFSFTGEAGSVPYWSPDSRFILLDGLHSLALVSIADQSHQTLLSDALPIASTSALPGVNALVQPVPNNLWAADSQHFLILTRGRLFWQGKQLASNGIYVVPLNASGKIDGQPALVDAGHDTQPGWSYEDPDTSFLFP
jgi:hypothetical protein